jgi:TolB-like protein
MSSIIEGYSYDIFVSYRQKDNKHDGWVTEFVNQLKGELESTFKEEISVYFDINPHDGLLETHDVDASLKEKLKCAVFIPIISRTYCDPKSFAWEHEFKSFIEQASKDKYGLKIKLSGGNIANRVLPVQIHDLDKDDKKMVESELGGFIRGMEFIYKSPGINRPLLPKEENPQDNLNHTNYRDQINKVANAIKEIISGLRNPDREAKEISIGLDEEKPAGQKRQRAKIITGALIVLALILAGYFIGPRLFESSKTVEKSIAVLPFINDSPVDSNIYFINGIMEEVLNNLMKIKDFRVLSRTSTDQYKGPDRPTIPEIAKKLGVNYIVEGSGQKIGNTFILRVQLIAADNKEKHLWAERYEQEIKEVKDYIRIQSLIARAIAAELKTIMTPEQIQLIEKVPTPNMTALGLYLKANDYLKDYEESRNLSSYQTAVNLYKTALGIDSSFAKAYTGLASAYYDRYYYPNYFKVGFLDSCRILAGIALSFDDQLDEAYYLIAEYYYANGQIEDALDNLDKALKINPNYYSAYYRKGYILARVTNDYVKGLENFHKALNIIQGNERSSLLRDLGYAYVYVGFIDKAKYYFQEALTLDGDSATYFGNMLFLAISIENFENAILFTEKVLKIDSTYLPPTEWLSFRGQHQEAYIVAKKRVEQLEKEDRLPLINSHRIGYAFYQIGKKKEADYYFKQQINYGTESIKLGRDIASTKAAQYNLAGTYAFLGDKTMAYQYLDEFNTMNFYPKWWIVYFKYDLLFDSIRNEERFQKIQQNIEAKYMAEHERVRKWLEEQGML